MIQLANTIKITYVGRVVDYYDSGPFDLIIPAGETVYQFSIEITNDNILEDMEMFNLTINPFSLPANVYVGNLSQTMVLIIDDDGKQINQLNQSSANVFVQQLL